MAYLRFVLSNQHPTSGVADGPFGVAHELRDDARVAEADRATLRDTLAWFDEHLAEPTRFNRTSSKGHYRRNAKGVTWFRDSAIDCIGRMHRIKGVLEAYGYPVTMIQEDRIGYVVYEDKHQVVAEPFSDTKTS